MKLHRFASVRNVWLHSVRSTLSGLLDRASLVGASLVRTSLAGANLAGANLKNISWDERTVWEDIRGIETAINVPEKLKQQLGL